MENAVPVSTGVWIWALTLTLLLPVGLTAGILFATSGHLLGPNNSRWILAAAYAVIVGAASWVLWSVYRTELSIENDQVSVGAGPFRYTFANKTIDRQSIKIGATPAPLFAIRTNGIGLPGYSGGWFKDSLGRKVFSAYGGGPWLEFQTTENTLVVVGARNPAKLAELLNNIAEPTDRSR